MGMGLRFDIVPYDQGSPGRKTRASSAQSLIATYGDDEWE
jgi:hypothetical protein